MNHIGKVISSGKLEVIASPAGCPNFIGYIKITNIKIHNQKNEITNLTCMYFKEYYFKTNGELKFKNLDIPKSAPPYRFNMCLMRIPSEFQYVAIDTQNKIHIEPNDKKIYGLTLLNIHIPNTTTKSHAEKTFIEGQTHYGEPVKENPFYNPFQLYYGGLRGCKSLGFPSALCSQIPLFYAKQKLEKFKEIKIDPRITGDLERYFMLSLGTEGTIGYCAFKSRNDLIDKVKAFNELMKMDPPDEKSRLGIKMGNHEIYTVDGFDNKYGVHIIDRLIENEDTDGWDVGWFKVIAYDKAQDPKKSNPKNPKKQD